MKHLTLTILACLALSMAGFCNKKPFHTTYFSSGEVYATYSWVKKAVKVTYYYPGGQVRESGYFMKGQSHGRWEQFSEEGTKVAEAYYVQGKRIGYWQFWNDAGQQQYGINYQDNEAIRYEIWDEMGNAVAYYPTAP